MDAKNTQIAIVSATTDQMSIVRTLFLEYQDYLGVDLCFQGFSEELETLPGRYAKPRGFVLLAMDDAYPCGCVAVRPLDKEKAELKRLFVRPGLQGYGIGGKLFESAMAGAKKLNYGHIFLDTLPQMQIAQEMYIKNGFVETEPYIHNPVEGVKYYECAL